MYYEDTLAITLLFLPFQVTLGGGRVYFRPDGTQDEEYPQANGDREDGQDLINMWLDKHSSETSSYVWNASAFYDIDPMKTDRLLGMS